MTAMYGIKDVLHLRLRIYILWVVLVIGLSLSNECLHLLKARGYQRFLGFYLAGIFFLNISILALAYMGFGNSAALWIASGVILAIYAVSLPFALVLSRHRCRITSPPPNADTE
jgi:hypothetical protein